MRAVLFALALLAIAASGAQKGKQAKGAGLELFRNGGFEDGLEGWRTLGQSGGVRFDVVDDVKAAGEHSLRITRSGQGGADFVKQFPELPVDEGEVNVSFRYRVDEGARLELVFYFFDDEGA